MSNLPTNITPTTKANDPTLAHDAMHNAENGLINAHDAAIATNTTAISAGDAVNAAAITAETNRATAAEATKASSVAGVPTGGTTGQVLIKTSGTDYATAWGTAGGGGTTILVAASTASAKLKAGADYVATGTNDHTTINTALSALPSGKGTVVLSAGTFSTSATINITADQVLEGQGMQATLIQGASTGFHVIHMGNRQADGIMRNYMGLRNIGVSSAGGANSYDTIWVDGMGTGGYMENVKSSEGRYNFRLTDIDQSAFSNLKGFNPRTASIYCEAGLENTWGNVGFSNISAALSDNNSICVLFDASAAQTSPNKFDRVSFEGGNLFYASTGLTGTVGMKFNVGATSMSLTNCLFENPQQHIVLIGQTFMSLRGVSFIQNSGVSTDILNLQTNNHTVHFMDSRFQQATNAFNGVSGYSNLVFSGRNTNQGTITNLFTGSFGSKQGTDTVFTGDGQMALGLNAQRYDYAFINKVAVSQSIQDSNTNAVIDITAASTPVNHLAVANSNTGVAPSITATGSDTNIDVNVVTKGTGQLKVNGAVVGGVSAATPTVAGKVLQTVYNVRDYGAVANGVTDDGPAINSAVTAAQAVGGICYIPEGTYLINTQIAKDADYITIHGAGKGKTILKAGSSLAYGLCIISLGNGAGPTARKYIEVEGITFDMNTTANTWGLSISWCAHVTIRNIAVINPSTTSFSMLFVGLFSNQSAAWNSNDILIDNCFFDYNNVASSWEAVTIGYARNVTISNITILTKPGAYPGLTMYGSEELTLTGSYFYQASINTGGRGPVHLFGNKFEGSRILVLTGDNHVIQGNSFYGTTADFTANRGVGIVFQGLYFQVGNSETPFYVTQPYTWSCKNNVINGNIFDHAGLYSITSLHAVSNTVDVLASDTLKITNNIIRNTSWDAFNVTANRLSILGNTIYNSGQAGGAFSNGVMAAKVGVYANNQSFDNQGTATTNHDELIDNSYVASFFPTQAWTFSGNTAEIDSGIIYYYNSGFTSVKPASITIAAAAIGSFLPLAGGTLTGPEIITTASVNALAVGPNGTTNPALAVNTNVASAVTGIAVNSNAVGGWASIATTSSAPNENLGIDSKGSGALKLQTLGGSGRIVMGQNAEIFSVSGQALAVGPNGSTNQQTLQVDSSTASSVTGLKIKGDVASGTTALSVIDSSGSNTNMSIDAKGTGILTLQGIATGGITLARDTTISDAKNLIFGTTTGTKIGTATTQKLGFFNATPVVQPSATTDIRTALGNLGLVASTTNPLNPRTNTTTSSATPAINTDTTDVFTITAQAAAITSMTTSLTGTPVNGQKLMVRIKDNGTAQTIAWGASFVSSGVATLLATTVISKTHTIGLSYDSTAAKWVCLAVDNAGY